MIFPPDTKSNDHARTVQGRGDRPRGLCRLFALGRGVRLIMHREVGEGSGDA